MAVARAEKERARRKKGKEEDDAATSDFEWMAPILRSSVLRLRSDGGDRFEAVRVE